jgi:hypothetical protein
VAQVTEHLPSKSEAVNSKPSHLGTHHQALLKAVSPQGDLGEAEMLLLDEAPLIFISSSQEHF